MHILAHDWSTLGELMLTLWALHTRAAVHSSEEESDEEDKETAAEKRVRLAREYLDVLKKGGVCVCGCASLRFARQLCASNNGGTTSEQEK